jgi:hypothetical protein
MVELSAVMMHRRMRLRLGRRAQLDCEGSAVRRRHPPSRNQRAQEERAGKRKQNRQAGLSGHSRPHNHGRRVMPTRKHVS